MFAMGYAISGVLAPLRVADSRVPKPWREADRGSTCGRAQYPETPGAWRQTQRVAITIPGRKWRSLAEAVPRGGFALVNAHRVLVAAGRERTKAYSSLVPTSGLNGSQARYQWARLHGRGEEITPLRRLESPRLGMACISIRNAENGTLHNLATLALLWHLPGHTLVPWNALPLSQT